MASISKQSSGALGGPHPFAPPTPADDSGGLNIKLLLRILQRRRTVFLSTTLAVTALAGLFTVYRRIQSPVFLGDFTLLISDPITDSAQRAGGDSGTTGGSIGSVALNVARNDVPTLIRVLESPAVLEPVYAALQKQYPGEPRPRINVGLVSASPGRQNPVLASGVLSVEARGSSPSLVNKTLKLTEQTYLRWSLEQRRQKLSEGVKFLDEQAPQLQARSAALQEQLENFRTRNNVLTPAEEAAAVRTRSEELSRDLVSQLAERQRLQKVRADVAAGRLTARTFTSTAGNAVSTAPDTGTSVTLDVPNQPLLTELNRLDQEIAQAKALYTSESPFLRNLIATRDELRPALQRKELEAVDATLQQLDGSIAALRSQLASTDARFRMQPPLLRQYEDLQRKLEIAEGNVANYFRTRDQFQLEIAQNNVPWSVIAPPAVNPDPVEPLLGRGLLQGLLLGLAAGTGAALLRDRLDHVFHSPAEVRDELNVPLLGHIPYISFFEGVRRDNRFLLESLDAQQNGIAAYQRFTYQEAFRNLYTSLRFLSSDHPVRSVALSSSVPSEGKSLLSVLLAMTLSELGRRVLLVDADLRQPQIHHRLGLNNLRGLSNLLTEEDQDWRPLLQTVPDHPGWHVLTAGQRVPDPPRLLSSDRMMQLVKDIANSDTYDLVLYDTPPTLGLADASLVAEHLDGILLVVGLSKVDRQLPRQAIERINTAGVPLLGVVTNARISSRDTYSIYGTYRYGYGSLTDGAGALDPSTAYSYYVGNANSTPPTSSPQGFSALIPNRENLSRWKRSIKNWMQ